MDIKEQKLRKLQETMKMEYDEYEKALLLKVPKEIIRLSYETAIKEMLVECIIYMDYLTEDEVNLLHEVNNPLNTLYNDWIHSELSIEAVIRDSIAESALELSYVEPEKRIKVLFCPVGKPAEVIEIDNTLEAMQKIVGGYIETAHYYNDPVVIVCDEEGIVKNKLPSRRVTNEKNAELNVIIYGDFFLCSSYQENFTSLLENMIDKYANILREAIVLDNEEYLEP